MSRSTLFRCWVGTLLLLLSSLVFAVDSSGAAARVQQETGGRVLSVERVQQGGQTVFKVKVLLANGDVRVVFVSAN